VSVWAGVFEVEVLRHYSNRPDLLKQLRRVVVIMSDDGRGGGVDADGEASASGVIRSRRLRDRFSPDDLQVMVDLYLSGTTAKQIAEKFGVSLRSVKRLLHEHDVHRRSRRL
jgi:DNA-directed RNA polymerase specialized sigma24 family protein